MTKKLSCSKDILPDCCMIENSFKKSAVLHSQTVGGAGEKNSNIKKNISTKS